MNGLATTIIFTSMTIGYMISQRWLPGALILLPEALAGFAALGAIVLGVQDRFRNVRPAYWLVFGALALVMIFGILVNRVEVGPVVAGVRHYMRPIPLFFLAAVVLIKDRQLRLLLLILLALSLMQIPLAWQQRTETLATGNFTGDTTFGTLLHPKSLTLFMIGSACIVTGLFLRSKIRARYFFPAFFLLLIPAMINESKAALFILPIGVLTIYMLGANPGQRLKSVLVGSLMVVAFVSVFVAVYDFYMKPRWGYGLMDFFVMEGRLEGYLDRGSEVGDYETQAGKIGGIRLALAELSKSPAELAFGKGIGNASDSSLGLGFVGSYYNLYAQHISTSLIRLLFEFGIIGTSLVFFVHWLIFRDAVAVAASDESLMGAVALGWAGVTVVFVIGIIAYSPVNTFGLGAIFWYVSGLVSGHRMSLLQPSSVRREGVERMPLSGGAEIKAGIEPAWRGRT